MTERDDSTGVISRLGPPGERRVDCTHPLRPSVFNVAIPATDDTPPLILNTLSRHLVALDAGNEALGDLLLSSGPIQPESPMAQYRDALASQGFLVPLARRERIETLRSLDACRFNTRTIGLTIMTTFACCMSCEYCFQHHHQEHMSGDVARAIVGRFAPLADKVDGIGITWFGGEPLLNVDAISVISAGLRERFRNYQSGIITNGYLLDAKNLDALLSCAVTNAQITLDGPGDFHDSRRPLRGGGGTFDRIWRNVLAASRWMKVNIRVNVDRELIEDPTVLAAFMCRLDVESAGRLSFSFAPVTAIADRPKSVARANLTRDEFSAGVERVYTTAIAAGFRGWIPWLAPAHGCTATTQSAYTIDPAGRLYRCWEEPTGQAEQPVGHVTRGTQSWDEQAHEMLYLGFSVHHAPQCTECRFQPVCGSGCPRSSLSPHRQGMEFEACRYTESWVPVVARTAYRAGKARGTTRSIHGKGGADGVHCV